MTGLPVGSRRTWRVRRVQSRAMTTLGEIEAAAERLSAEQKGELLLFLATRLRAGRAALPEGRDFSTEQITAWVAEDEADFKALGPLP